MQSPPAGTQGFSGVRKRGVVERTNARNGRSRRNSRDDERTTVSPEAPLQVSAIQIVLHRLAPDDHAVTFNYRRTITTPATIAA